MKEWDQILRATGFVDIEKTVGLEKVLIQNARSSSSDAYRKLDPTIRENKVAYYDLLSDRVRDESFDNETDRYVMVRISEGAKIKEIVCELMSRGESIHRQTCRYIIRRYENRWGIRVWTNRQMYLRTRTK